jgi:TRAP-type C4-dicarboxylate transport system substrate-binding protein
MAMENMSEGTGRTLETIPWEDLYNALERGVVDGCWAAYGHMVDNRLVEVTSYYTELGLGWDAANVVMNLEAWESLPADLQDAITLAAIRAQERDLQAERFNNFAYKEWILNNTDMVITELTPEQRAVFRDKANMGEVWDELVTPWLDKTYPGQNMTQKMMDDLDYIKSVTG